MLGISPDSTADEILAASPGKHAKDLVELVVDTQRDHKALTERAVEALRTVRDLQEEHTRNTLGALDGIEDLLKQDQLSRAQARQHERRRQEAAIKVRGAQATVYLAATLIGLGDPKLGHQIQTVGDATITVYKAWETFSEVTEELQRAEGLCKRGFECGCRGGDTRGHRLCLSTPARIRMKS